MSASRNGAPTWPEKKRSPVKRMSSAKGPSTFSRLGGGPRWVIEMKKLRTTSSTAKARVVKACACGWARIQATTQSQ
jgi:hypothetical protein